MKCRISSCDEPMVSAWSNTKLCLTHLARLSTEPPLCVCAAPDVTSAGIAGLPNGAECSTCRRPFYGYEDSLRDEWRAFLGATASKPIGATR